MRPGHTAKEFDSHTKLPPQRIFDKRHKTGLSTDFARQGVSPPRSFGGAGSALAKRGPSAKPRRSTADSRELRRPWLFVQSTALHKQDTEFGPKGRDP